MKYQTRPIKFHEQQLNISYRNEADLSVIDEIFVDKMYRALEQIIANLEYPILDIGAHIGLFSVYSSILNSKVSIIALEPEPDNFKLMKENLKINHCKNVKVKQVALMCHPDQVLKERVEGSLTDCLRDSSTPLHSTRNDNKTATLYLNEDSHNHSTFYRTENSIIVPATTLEELITKNKLTKIGLLKMDIEGGEFDIIKTLKHESIKTIANMAIEYHEFDGNKRTDLEYIIRSQGFSVEHFPNHFDKRFGLFICRNKKISN